MIAALCCGQADAATVADGCATPNPQAQRNTYYVDPANGSMSNDGSAARPWSTLADVLDGKRKLVGATIKPGDIVYLNSGDHGNVQIAGAVNSDFITVQAAPGQTPMLRSLRVNGASKWMFVGLKVQGAGDGSSNSLPGPALIEFGRSGPTSDIVFAGNSVSTTDDTSRWTDTDWVKKPFATGLTTSATCVTISGNHFSNVRNAISLEGDRILVADNKIDNFGNDGIDVVASNVTIRGNTITDGRHTKSEPLHPDGIQGWTKPGATNTNVVIDRNTIIKTGDTQASAMQGISIFDGKWDGLTISQQRGGHQSLARHRALRNCERQDHQQYRRGVRSGEISDLDHDSEREGRNPVPQCHRAKQHHDAAQLHRRRRDAPTTTSLRGRSAATAAGKTTFMSKPGTYGDGNRVDPNIYGTLVTIDNARARYDLRLKANSPAVGAGNPDSAPATDILGKPRSRPVDVGAYAYVRSR